MKRSNFSLLLIILSSLLVYNCDALRSEDEKISNALIGKYYEDDDVNKSGETMKNIKGEYFKDGKFTGQVTFESVDENFETIEITFQIGGAWKVKDKFIYSDYDFNSIKIIPEIYMLGKDALIKEIKDKNTPSKVIDYDASKVIYEDSDGKRRTMKKSY